LITLAWPNIELNLYYIFEDLNQFTELFTFTFNVISSSAVLTWVGAMCGHILSLYSNDFSSNDFSGTRPFLEKILPNKSDTFYHRLDLVLLPIIGAILAFCLLDPNSAKSSIFAGLSWSGTITALLKKNAAKSLENNV
jgi:hypothetical protein